MPWGAGTFSRTIAGGWSTDKATTPNITASRHDTNDDDLATGINACLNKAGQNSPTADISWGSNKITSIGNATARTDVPSMGQVQDGAHSAVTAGGTGNVLTATLAPALTALVTNQKVRLKLSATNTGAATLNVSGLGATAIVTKQGNALVGGELKNGQLVELVYNGTSWVLLTGGPSFYIKTATSTSVISPQVSASGGTKFDTDLSITITTAGPAFIELQGSCQMDPNTTDRAVGCGITKDSTTGISTGMDFVEFSRDKEATADVVVGDANAVTGRAYGFVTVAAGTHVFRLTHHSEGSNSIHAGTRFLIAKVHDFAMSI